MVRRWSEGDEHAGPTRARAGDPEPGGVRAEHRPGLAAAEERAAGGTAEAIRAASWHTRRVLAGWSDGPGWGAAQRKLAMKSSIGMAAIVSTRTVPREDSSAETRAIAWWSCASSTLTKS